MMLALAPIFLLLTAGVLGMLGYALGLTPPTAEWLSPRASSGLLGSILVWFASGFVRHILRDEEQTRAERLARDTLLREQNVELWTARQMHEAAVREKTAEILTALRGQPLHRRLRRYLRPTPGEVL